MSPEGRSRLRAELDRLAALGVPSTSLSDDQMLQLAAMQREENELGHRLLAAAKQLREERRPGRSRDRIDIADLLLDAYLDGKVVVAFGMTDRDRDSAWAIRNAEAQGLIATERDMMTLDVHVTLGPKADLHLRTMLLAYERRRGETKAEIETERNARENTRKRTKRIIDLD